MAGPYDNLNPIFSQRLQALINASGGRLRPGSGYRSYEEQAQLYQNYINGVPGQARAARPGHSKHNMGLAMDLQGDLEWAAANAAQFGLYFPMDDEPWHIQPIGDQELSGWTPEGGQGGFMPGQPGIQYGLNYTGAEDTRTDEEKVAERIQAVMSLIDPEVLAQSEGSNVQPVYDPAQDILEESAPYSAQTTQAPEAGPRFDQAMDPLGPHYQAMIPQNGAIGAPVGGGTPQDPSGYAQIAQQMFQQYGWGPEELPALIALWNSESGDGTYNTARVTWNPNADNPTSTAAGIAQKLQSMHGPVEGTPQGQIAWGLNYIAHGSRNFHTPTQALRFKQANNWY